MSDDTLPIQECLDVENAGPQVVGHGRIHRLEVEVCVSRDASPEQIASAIAYELGSGAIDLDHPLFDGGWEFHDVLHREDTGVVAFTLWDAADEHEPGKRHGKTVLRKEGEPLGFEYESPEKEQNDE